jgi:2,5-dihydroxypyridine 5,6-dioxygenase
MRAQEINPAKLAMLFRKQFEMCNVKRGETIALLGDLNTRQEYVQAAFAAGSDLGADVYEMKVNAIPSWTKVGVETVGACKGTVEALSAADMLVCLHIPLFTKWMKVVRDAGTRVLMIIDAPDDLEQLMSPPGLKEACIHSGKRLEETKTVRVTSDAGTDFTYECGDFPTMVQYGYAEEPGRFDHWGGGHVHTFPNEGSATGTVVIAPGDLVILPYNRYVQDEIRLEIREGHIRKIEGGLDAKLMNQWLEDNRAHPEDMDGHAISHLGWGLNPQARWNSLALYGDDPDRTYAAARTFPGNFLFSTGPNSQGGGKRNTNGHYDVPMRDCTVMLDNDVIIDKGNFVDPQMAVERVAR